MNIDFIRIGLKLGVSGISPEAYVFDQVDLRYHNEFVGEVT